MGPGVTPIVRRERPDPGAVDARNPAKVRLEESLNAELSALGDARCMPG